MKKILLLAWISLPLSAENWGTEQGAIDATLSSELVKTKNTCGDNLVDKVATRSNHNTFEVVLRYEKPQDGLRGPQTVPCRVFAKVKANSPARAEQPYVVVHVDVIEAKAQVAPLKRRSALRKLY